jgi:hypothetical protein
MIASTWDTALHLLDTLPPWVAAFLIGWAFSVGVTQGIKFTMPEAYPAGWREAMSRWVAFLTAAVPAGAWLYNAGGDGLGVVMGTLITGAWSPIAYALLIGVLRRSAKTEWIADVLSQDKRGVVAAKLRGES